MPTGLPGRPRVPVERRRWAGPLFVVVSIGAVFALRLFLWPASPPPDGSNLREAPAITVTARLHPVDDGVASAALPWDDAPSLAPATVSRVAADDSVPRAMQSSPALATAWRDAAVLPGDAPAPTAPTILSTPGAVPIAAASPAFPERTPDRSRTPRKALDSTAVAALPLTAETGARMAMLEVAPTPTVPADVGLSPAPEDLRDEAADRRPAILPAAPSLAAAPDARIVAMADDDIEVMAFTPATASPDAATAIVSIDRGIDTTAPRGDDLASYGFLRKAQRIPFGHAAAVPVGYYELCVGHPDECRPSHGWMGQWSYQFGMHLDAARMKQLIAVNASVNHSIRQRTDRALYHVTDRWVVNPKAGDCEDYALTKKARLIADGWPSSALLVALAKTRAGQDHAVLVVRTDRGDLVLDSLRSTIRGWTPSLYRWRSVQSPTDTWAWFTIDKAPKPVVASALGEPSLRRDLSTAVVVFE